MRRAGRPPRAVPDVRAGGAGARRPVPQPAAAGSDLVGQASVEDCWGRALWGLGTAVARVPHLDRERALAGFDAGLRAALAAPARDGVRRARSGGGPRRAAGPPRGAGADDRGRDRGRPPRGRRGVAMARAAAELRQRGARPKRCSPRAPYWTRPHSSRTACRLLGWLLDEQSRDGHLSVVQAGGRGPGEAGPAFDQQPIEVAALADACARAYLITGRAALGRGSRARCGMVLRRQRLRHPDARSGDRRRLRRSAARRAQREPGRGVHAGAALDAAAGPVHGSPRPPDHPTLDEGRRRMKQGVMRTDVVLTADPSRVLARLFVPGHELLARGPVPGVGGHGEDPRAARGRGRLDGEARA